MITREVRRRLAFGLTTLLGGRRRGVFIPYRYADRLPPAGRRDAYPVQGDLLESRAPAMRGWLEALEGYAEALQAISETGGPPEPRWGQSWFPGLDAALAYTILRTRRPKRIVEIGSGHSTRFLARALRDGGLNAEIRCIDPAPRAPLDGLPVTLQRMTLQEAGTDVLAGLASGDVLFVDSSHVLVPGSDVDLVLTRLLPRLPQGALVHLHDIFLPDDYPAAWAWRGYNEQPAVAGLLTAGWRVLVASHYVRTRLAGRVAAGAAGRLPVPAEAVESSLWLEKTGARV